MSLKETINQDIKQAMKAKDQDALRALRAIKAAILVVETSEGRKDPAMSPAEELSLLTKQAKQRRDSITQFTDNGRKDLADIEAAELTIIERYLPEALSPEEIQSKVREIVERVSASSMKDMGKVMGLASQEMKGQADGKEIAAIVREILSA